jgi:hypothetical protein
VASGAVLLLGLVLKLDWEREALAARAAAVTSGGDGGGGGGGDDEEICLVEVSSSAAAGEEREVGVDRGEAPAGAAAS